MKRTQTKERLVCSIIAIVYAFLFTLASFDNGLVTWVDIIVRLSAVALIVLNIVALVKAPDGSCRKMAIATVLFCTIVSISSINKIIFDFIRGVYFNGYEASIQLFIYGGLLIAKLLASLILTAVFFILNSKFKVKVYENEAGKTTGTVNRFLIKILPLFAAVMLFMSFLHFAVCMDRLYGSYVTVYDIATFNDLYQNVYDGWLSVILGLLNIIFVLAIFGLGAFSIFAAAKLPYKKIVLLGRISLGIFTVISFVILLEGLIGIIIWRDSGIFTLSFIPFIIMAATLGVHIVFAKKAANETLEASVEAQVNEQNGQPAQNAQTAQNEPGKKKESAKSKGRGHMDMLTLVLLILFVPCYMYYWIYRTNDYLRGKVADYKRENVTTLLLCLFVPFYWIYWAYVSAQAIEKLSKENGRNCEIATMCLILSFFVSVIPAILMQKEINELEEKCFANAAPCAAQPETVNGQPENSFAQEAAAADDVNDFAPSNESPAPSNVNVANELEKYKALLDCGAITQEEYDAKKAELLK